MKPMTKAQRRRIAEQLVKKMQKDMFEDYVEDMMETESDEELLRAYEEAFQMEFHFAEGDV